MSITTTDASKLAEEYRALAKLAGWGLHPDKIASNHLRSALVKKSDWTPEAADELLFLAREYGAFMLRNALALAAALEIEDGRAGY
ncbi:MAG: hypothetical protein HKL96_03880 [Phycisphaerales bacterium]|nr:hypothetical protein [Phycisphaerales bacterium]